MDDSFITQLKKSVGFIYIKKDNKFSPAGTGFFVSILTGYDPSKSYIYFVTAKHVLQKNNGEAMLKGKVKDTNE